MENIKGLPEFFPVMRISALELGRVERDRTKLATLRAEAELLTRTLGGREDDIIRRTGAGARVQGQAVVVTRRRQNISWLTVVKRQLGQDAIVKVKDEWPVTFYKELQIS